jgi:hypothetical protein
MKRIWKFAVATLMTALIPAGLCRAAAPTPATAPADPSAFLSAPVGAWVEMRPAESGFITLNATSTWSVPGKPVTYLGVSLDSINDPLRTQLQIPADMGLLITWVDEQSPSKDLLAKHDVILRLDDQIIFNADQLLSLIRMHKPGDDVKVHLVRHAMPIDVVVKLSEKNVGGGEYLFRAEPGRQPLVSKNAVELSMPAQYRDLFLTYARINAAATTSPTTAPASQPDRATIVRRLYLDVTGVQPTDKQILDFVNDNSPDAYQKLVEELIKHRPVVIQAPDQESAGPKRLLPK